MAKRYETMKNTTFLSRKLEELLILKAVQSFSAKMLPFFNPENYPFINEFYSSIMATDSSPTAEYKEFTYATHPPIQGRATPPPTTSNLSARQESQAIAIDPSVSSKPPAPDYRTEDPNKDTTDKDDVDMSSPNFNNAGYKPEGREDDKCDSKDEKRTSEGGGVDSKLNGGNRLEPAFLCPLDAKDSDEESESCVVNCLYYTMQCCECVIT